MELRMKASLSAMSSPSFAVHKLMKFRRVFQATLTLNYSLPS